MATASWRPTVDTHAHVFTRALLGGTRMKDAFSRDFTYGDYVAALDEVGISHGVIAAATFLGTNCSYTLQALKAHDRLRATVIVPPEISTARLEDLQAAGVVGIRIGTGNADIIPDLGSPEYRRLFARLAEMGWHVHIYGKPAHIAPLLDALQRSAVNVVVDHFGMRGTDTAENLEAFAAVLDAVDHGRTWVKLSGAYLSDGIDHGQAAWRLLEHCGPERLLWGSDWPFVHLGGRFDIPRTIEWIEDWLPDGALRSGIDRTALDFYGFRQSGRHAV